MKVYERVLLVLYPLSWILAALMLLYTAGWNQQVDNLWQALEAPTNRLALGIGAAVLMLVALKLLLDNFRRPAAAHAVVRRNPGGEVSITLNALENLVVRSAHRVKGVREVRPRIKVTPEGVEAFVQTSFNPETQIPEGSAELQRVIKEGLEQTAGVDVLQVRILVDGIGHETRGRVD